MESVSRPFFLPHIMTALNSFCRLSEVINEVTSNSLSTCTKSAPSPLSSPNGKLTIASPKRGQKREEGWKEVVRR